MKNHFLSVLLGAGLTSGWIFGIVFNVYQLIALAILGSLVTVVCWLIWLADNWTKIP